MLPVSLHGVRERVGRLCREVRVVCGGSGVHGEVVREGEGRKAG